MHFRENLNDWELAKNYRINRWDAWFKLGVDDNHGVANVLGGSDFPDDDDFKSYTVR